MNAKTAIAAVAALMLIAGSAYALDLPFGLGGKLGTGKGYAATQDGGDWTPGYCRMGRWGAGLTEEQRETIQKKMAEHRKEMQELGIERPGFVDEDGDGVCDYAGTGGCGAWSGQRRGRWG